MCIVPLKQKNTNKTSTKPRATVPRPEGSLSYLIKPDPKTYSSFQSILFTSIQHCLQSSDRTCSPNNEGNRLASSFPSLSLSEKGSRSIFRTYLLTFLVFWSIILPKQFYKRLLWFFFGGRRYRTKSQLSNDLFCPNHTKLNTIFNGSNANFETET